MKAKCIFFAMILISCYDDENKLIQIKSNDLKALINNSDNWYVTKYYKNNLDSTKLFSKYYVSFKEDQECAEIITFNMPNRKIQGIWDVLQYADGTVIKFWITSNYGFNNLQGEWYINFVDKNKLHIFRDNREIIFVK